MATIFEVQVTTHSEDENTFKTLVFTDKEKAIDCVTYLFSKRFDDTDGLTNNPFSGMDESEQDTTTLHKTSSIIDGVERIEGFAINDWYAPCDLDVSIEEKELDMEKKWWNF